jgi:SAM-dependent methyltransferase
VSDPLHPDEPTDGSRAPLDYGRSFADVYDDWYADVTDVTATVARVAALAEAAGGARVLELGVGSGRLALPMAATGLAVEGIDTSAAMLALLADKAGADTVVAHLGDMAEADSLVDGTFHVVLVAFNTFFNLDTEAQQQRCLEAAATILDPRGSLVIEAWVPTDPPTTLTRDLSVTRVDIGRLVIAATEHDPVAQTITGQHVDITADGTRLRPWRLRYATPVQIDEMAARAGLQLVERHSGWDHEPITTTSLTHVSRYALAGGAE